MAVSHLAELNLEEEPGFTQLCVLTEHSTWPLEALNKSSLNKME